MRELHEDGLLDSNELKFNRLMLQKEKNGQKEQELGTKVPSATEQVTRMDPRLANKKSKLKNCLLLGELCVRSSNVICV